VFGFLRRRRRARLVAGPFPEPWRRIIADEVAIWQCLPGPDRDELLRHARILLAEKHFEGCGGLVLDDRHRVVIAALASVLLLHRSEPAYFPYCKSVLVYPAAFRVDLEEPGPDGVVYVDEEARLGESWDIGAVVFAWDDVVHSAADSQDGYNLVLHEFAHQLDLEDGISAALEALEGDTGRLLREGQVWFNVLSFEYDRLVRAVDAGRPTWLDPYAAEHPAEFFAVVTEHFFEEPRDLRQRFPELYDAFSRYYRQNPAEWGRG
jgi:hypothetical protein